MDQPDLPDQPTPDEGPAAASSQLPFFYANAVTLHGRPFDVMLDFALRTPETDRGPLTEQELVARIGCSWGHLKSMLPLLARMVADYEEANGVIPAPGFEDDSRL